MITLNTSKKSKALVAYDDREMNKVMRERLEEKGFIVDVADADEFAYAYAFFFGQHYDVAFICPEFHRARHLLKRLDTVIWPRTHPIKTEALVC